MLPRLSLFAAVFVLALTAGSPGADPRAPAEPEKALGETLRRLEKEISAARGLAFKTPVKARVISRPTETPKRLQGYYRIQDQTLYLFDDLSGAYREGVLIHEMVHALQDQHFGLKKLHQLGPSPSDADLARAALIEGDATYTMILVLKKRQPAVARMLDSDLATARHLNNAFLYAQGARYVRALQQKGGWEAVNRRYRFPPQTTAAILHPEGVTTVVLGPGQPRGELGLIRFLRDQGLDARSVELARGWKADRSLAVGPARAWTVAFHSPARAHRLQEALARAHVGHDAKARAFPAGPGVLAWQGEKGVHALIVQTDRVHILDAPNREAYQALRDRLEGSPLVTITATKAGKKITFGRMIDRLMRADVICIGESHDSELHHRVQLQVIKAIHARDERVGVGLEMFQSPYQKVMDQFLRGDLDEKNFLDRTEYEKRWGYDWSLYRPVVEFCRRNALPIAALNASRELTRQISKVGIEGLEQGVRKQLETIDLHVKAHRAYWFDRLAEMHGHKDAPPERKERSYQVMAVWDGYMANRAAHFLKDRHLRRLVVLAGSGHIDRRFGIPDRIARRTGKKVMTIHIDLEGEEGAPADDNVADFVVRVR